MPRATMSRAGMILAYFRTAPMEIAEEILALSKDELNARKAKGDKVRQGRRAHANGTETTTAAAAAGPTEVAGTPVKAAKKDKRKNRKRNRKGAQATSGEQQPGLLGDQPQTAEEIAQVLGDEPETGASAEVAGEDELVGAGVQQG